MNKKELKKAFDEKLIYEEQYKQRLFELETTTPIKKRKANPLPKSVRPEEFQSLIKAISIKKKYINRKIAFLLAYGSGMRISEVLKCRAEHFRDKPASIFIPASKNDVERVVPIPKGWKSDFLLFLPIQKDSRSLQRWFKTFATKAGLNPKYSFHSLRHGFATRLLEGGAPINQVQLLLGHKNLSTTSIYTKANPVDAIKSYEDLF